LPQISLPYGCGLLANHIRFRSWRLRGLGKWFAAVMGVVFNKAHQYVAFGHRTPLTWRRCASALAGSIAEVHARWR